jgi:hypothetical protein
MVVTSASAGRIAGSLVHRGTGTGAAAVRRADDRRGPASLSRAETVLGALRPAGTLPRV